VVTAVSSDKKKVDVKHAVIGTLRTGEELDAYETKDVEILFISSSGLSIKHELAVDDPVLLVGLKDYVEKTTSITVESQKSYTHYNQATLKAIPLAGILDDAKIQIKQNGEKLSIKNSTKSLFTVLNNIATHTKSIATNLQSATTINCVVGSPLTFNPTTIANFVTDASNLTTDANDLAALLEA
jgi:hypothetical protein